MRTRQSPVAVWMLAAVLFLSLGLAPAGAYDEKKCKKSVSKLSKHVKPYKNTNFKKLLKVISKLDDEKGGIDPKELEEAVEVPFEDLTWSKKFIKYLNQVEKHCAK